MPPSDPSADSTIAPLFSTDKIVNPDGTPTQYFQRWAQERSLDISGGITYTQLLQVLAEISIIAGVGLSGGGPINDDVTIDLEDTAVTPGTYGDATHVPQFTVDQQGRLTFADDVAISAGANLEVDYNGVPVVTPSTTKLNFIGAGVTVTNPVAGEADITIAGGGGGGGSGAVVAAARVDCTNPAVPVIAYGTNVSSIVKTGTGRYTINFTTPIDPTKVAFSAGGEWSPNPSVEIVILGIDREGGPGLLATSINVINYYINPAAIAIYDNNYWFSFELLDVTASGGGGGMTLIGHVTTAGSQADVQFNAIPATYKHLQIVSTCGSEDTNTGNTQNVTIQFNGDTTGGHYSQTGFGVYGAVAGFPSGPMLVSAANAGAPFAQWTLNIRNYLDTVQQQGYDGQGGAVQVNVGALAFYGMGYWTGIAAITDILLKPTGGFNWKDGSEFWLYGIPG